MGAIKVVLASIKAIITKTINSLGPLKQDDDIKKRLLVLSIFSLIYYVTFFSTVFIVITYGFQSQILFLLLLFFGFLPCVFIVISLLRIYQYISGRSFIPGGIGLFFAAFFITYITPRFLNFLAERIYILDSLGIDSILSTPFDFANQIIPVVIGVWIALRFSQEVSKRNLQKDKRIEIKKAVESILDSEEFLTALKSSLPRGEEDKEYGLDYIPYMLSENEIRLKELKKTTRFYFLLTLGVGLVVTIVVVYFGYLLVNEEAAGTPKTLSEINQTLSNIDSSMAIVFDSDLESFQSVPVSRSSDIFGDILYFEGVNYDAEHNDEINEVIQEVKANIDEAYNTNDWNNLYDSLNLNLSRIRSSEILSLTAADTGSSGNEEFIGYLNSLEEFTGKVGDYVSSKDNALISLNTGVSSLNDLIDEAESQLGTEDARTTELIKRLGLSLIVASFLLAVLRYTSSIYKDHYHDMRKAQSEGQTIRRFYIALKSSFKTKEGSTPNQIIAGFVNRSESLISKESSLQDNDLKSDINADLIKELLSVLSKKI